MAIIGLLMRTVVTNYRGDIPYVAVRATATELAARLNFLRAEARLQGGRYGMEIDVEKQVFRILMPPERRKPKEDEAKLKDRKMKWQHFEKGVKLTGINLGTKEEEKRNGKLYILFDERGRTQQKVLLFRHRDDPELVYSVVIPPLAGTIEAIKGDRGFPVATDLDF